MAPPRKSRITLPCHVCEAIFEVPIRSLTNQSYKEEGIVFCGRPCYQQYKIAKVSNSEEIFWSRVSKTPGQGPHGDCWEWQGTIGAMGYGEICWVAYRRAQGKMKGKISLAHRTSYELAVGPIPEGLSLLHSCDNPPCCNPAHLSPGTQGANVQDAWDKDRMHKGETCWNAIHTNDLIKEVKLYLLIGYSQIHISEKFKMREKMVNDIARGHKWKHIIVTEEDLASRPDLKDQFDMEYILDNRRMFNLQLRKDLGQKPHKRRF